MRYSKDENTYILAEFTSGDSVKIDIYRLSDNDKVVGDANVPEILSTGTFKYLFNITVTEKTEFLLIMNNGVIDKRGKLTLGGYPDELLEDADQMKTTISGVQVDLDNPDQYKADVSSLALADEYDTALSDIQADLNNTSQYKADISALSLESTTSAIKASTDTINWADITFIKNIEGGRWKIDTIEKQMIFYNEEGTSVVARFQLYDKDHTPSNTSITERERMP
jgi:hypothetical protein